MRFSIKSKITVLCGVFLLVFIPSTIFLLWNLRRIVENFRHVVYDTEDIVAESRLLSKIIVDMETGQRGFIITGKEEFLEPYNTANEKFDETLIDLRKHLADRPEYLAALEKIEHLRYEWLGKAGKPEIQMRRLVGETEVDLKGIEVLITAEVGKKVLDQLRVTMDEMSDSFRKAGRKDELILITQIGKDVVDSETGERGFLLAGKDRFLGPYYSGQIAFSKHVKELREMLQEDKTNLEKLSNVKKLYEEWLDKAARPEIHARVMYEHNTRSMDDIVSILAAGRGKKIIDELRELTGKFIDDLTKDMEEELSQSERSATLANFISLIISGAGILLALFLAFFIGRAIINPIGVLIGGTSLIGKGDLTHRIRVKSKDELGTLADSFNKMIEDLSVSMQKEKKRAAELDAANQQLRASEQQLKAANQQLGATVQELQKTQAQLVQSEKLAAVGQLAAGVGHELRNPLAVIKNAVYYIKTRIGEEPKLIKHVGIMEREIASSNKIITDLLGFSKVSKGEFSPTDINTAIDGILSITALPRNIKLTKEFTPDLPQVLGDPTQIKQVFLNMILNAQDAMEEGGELKITTRRVEGFAEIEFTDTGCGISEKNLKKLFDPFFTTKAKGVGLGLAVCYGIIERHKGSIEVKSEVGEGTIFTVKFPLKEG